MKLSNKIILGFLLTNIVYLLLLAGIYMFVRPLGQASTLLSTYLMPFNDLIADMKYNAAEERSNLRSFEASPNKDRALFDKAMASLQTVGKDLTEINKILNDPAAAYLHTPALKGAYQNAFEAYNVLPALVDETYDRRMKEQGLRMANSETAQKALDYMDAAIKAENDALIDEVKTEFTEDVILGRHDKIIRAYAVRAAIYESWLNYSLGIIRGSQEMFDRALNDSEEAEKRMSELSAITSNNHPEIKEALDKAKDILDNTYGPELKAFLQYRAETEAFAAKRGALVETLVESGTAFNDAINARFDEFTANLTAIVSQVVTSMLFGVIVALIASIFLTMFITRSIVRPINAIIGDLNISAQEVDSASNQLTSAANTLASGATENAASLEETSASLEELSSMTKRNADNAAEAKALMGQATDIVSQAEGSMVKVIGAMEEISRSGNEIGKIIKTIDEIAFQTNLLALNAAVEAARAGEAGAGFAVVADEVRNLAIRSADAAKNTADLIAATIGNINSGSEMVNVTSEAFKQVSVQVGKVRELVSEVAEASGEQSQGIDQISTAMSEMDKVTQSNAASAEESASAAGQLSLQAGNLLNVVSEMQALAHGAEKGRGGGQAGRPAMTGPQTPQARALAPGKGAAPGGSAPKPSDADKVMPMDDHFDF